MESCGLWHVNALFNKFLRALCWAHERIKHSDVDLFPIIFNRVKLKNLFEHYLRKHVIAQTNRTIQ